MHAWHARSVSRPFCYRKIVLTASKRNQRSHRDFTAVHVNLALPMLGVGSSTLEGEHNMRSPALDLTPEPYRAPSLRYRRPDGQVSGLFGGDLRATRRRDETPSPDQRQPARHEALAAPSR